MQKYTKSLIRKIVWLLYYDIAKRLHFAIEKLINYVAEHILNWQFIYRPILQFSKPLTLNRNFLHLAP